ncbi:CoA pyrophosphatase [Gilvimarinus sp. SDUM040013]|uniref:CoA pyrophosphatase n=1 Tax=Gilvimarinus gilvus TaxID=3058038 RepID=A0ABU4RYA5_9GAMM|nr:CoA pyrophosphatase [Gilvimarinus sp. SDUM040013]MDO3386591.1 CoA pyrophosphatase [Gilvimarinus sp. SDUM040013]MDX6849167.1 CoA pyrophosphatase [Gilvimarinus sp. SDUM040013]
MSNPRWLSLTSQLLPAARHQPQGPFVGQAAVLLALSGDPQDPTIVLTRRAAHLAHHPSEIAFPGGKWESHDTNLVATALRESFEEIGLASDKVEVLGRYPDYQTRRGVVVTPVIGVIPEKVTLVPDPAELDRIFTMPLRLLQADEAVAWRSYEHEGKHYRIPQFKYKEYTIWGLTAAIATRLAADALRQP